MYWPTPASYGLPTILRHTRLRQHDHQNPGGVKVAVLNLEGRVYMKNLIALQNG